MTSFAQPKRSTLAISILHEYEKEERYSGIKSRLDETVV
jgi:hypothetical protein